MDRRKGHLGGAVRESLQGGADHDAGCGAIPTGSARLWRPRCGTPWKIGMGMEEWDDETSEMDHSRKFPFMMGIHNIYINI